MTFESSQILSNILFVIAFILTFSVFFYAIRQKKKLSDEDLLHFEKKIKPKILKMFLLICLPTLGLCFHAITCVGDINMNFILISAIASLIITASTYIISKQITNKSGRQREYNYVTHYLLIMGITQLVLMTALTCLFLELTNK